MNYLASERVLTTGESYLMSAEMLEEIRTQGIKVSKQVGLPAQNEVCSKIVPLK